jgi:hypothetical protein
MSQTMKEINLPSGNYLFIEIPNDVLQDRWFVVWDEENNTFNVEFQTNDKPIYTSLNTEKDCYIISTTKDITEEQAGSIVEFDEINGEHPDFVNGVAWLNYKRNRYEYNRVFTVKESLQSLIQANGLDINKNYLILKKL